MADEIEKKGVKKEKKPFSVFGEMFDWIESTLLGIIGVMLVFTFLVRVTTVDGQSMMPTLQNENRLLISDLMYEPAYGDIVVLQANGLVNDRGEYGMPIVKRVIGLPGDTIDIDFEQGVVYRNGEPLAIRYINAGSTIYEENYTINALTHLQQDFDGEVTVPEGHIFVLGDNRNDSLDSRSSSVGMVNQNYIVGRAFLRVTPFSEFGLIDWR